MRFAAALMALAAAISVTIVHPTAGSPSRTSQRLTIRTEDGISLAATWHETSARPAPAVILVHMLNRSRRDWDGVAARFAAEGIGALALDLRGHGESTGEAPADLASLVLDLKAARRHLAARPEVQQSRVGLAGASGGANLAVLEAADDPTVASLALLSPSLDYRGLRIEAALRKVGNRPVLLVASDDDAYAVRTVKDLHKAAGGVREILLLTGAGHGTNMLERAPDLPGQLIAWFRRTLQLGF